MYPRMPQIIFLILIPFANTSCFLPNGTLTLSLGAQPCSSNPLDPLSSTCCNTAWTNPPGSDVKFGSTKDICLPNGLCQNMGFSTIVGKEQPPWTHFYRNYCTQKEGMGCVGVCDTGLNAESNLQMTPCDGTGSSEMWCCGDTRDCCEGVGVRRAVFVMRVLANSTLSNSTDSTMSEPTGCSTNLPKKDAKSWTIGVGVGVGLGLPVMFALGMALSAVKSKWRGALAADVQNQDVTELQGRQAKGDAVKEASVEELETTVGELYEQRTQLELDGCSV